MKHAKEYAGRIRRLINKVKREGGASAADIDEPMDLLLHAIFSTYAAEARSQAAVSRLRAAVVDINELRVTTVAEMVEAVGADFPMCRAAAEEICATLSGVYNRRHNLDLEFLRKAPRKTCETFLNSLDGLGAHARALFLLRSHKGHPVPLDLHMLAYLQKIGAVPPDATAEEAQKFVGNHLKDSEVNSFYLHLKRYAAAHAPRKWPEPRMPAPEPVKPVEPPAPVAAKKPAAKVPAGKAHAMKVPAAKIPAVSHAAKADPGTNSRGKPAKGAPPKKAHKPRGKALARRR